MIKMRGWMTGLWLAAIILAVTLILPDPVRSQETQPGSRVQSSPRQTDKSLNLERLKKRRKKIRKRRQQDRSTQKGKGPTAVPTQPAVQPLRSGPLGPAGK